MEIIPEEHKKLFVMLNPILDLARPYFAPPNIPTDRAKVLQTAFADMTNDPNFRAEVKRVARIEPSLVPGPEMDAAIKQMLSQPDEVKNRIIDLLRGN
jgi:tripartite-type tricarboxylate transporter receptor subunit TctC